MLPLIALHRFDECGDDAAAGVSRSASVWGDGAFSMATSSTSLQLAGFMLVSRVISVEFPNLLYLFSTLLLRTPADPIVRLCSMSPSDRGVFELLPVPLRDFRLPEINWWVMEIRALHAGIQAQTMPIDTSIMDQ